LFYSSAQFFTKFFFRQKDQHLDPKHQGSTWVGKNRDTAVDTGTMDMETDTGTEEITGVADDITKNETKEIEE